MHVKKLVGLGAASVALVVLPSAALGATGTKVSVRVEGQRKTLLPPTTVHTHGGWITKDGTARGSCPETSGAGALDVATKHNWAGTNDKFGLEITSIFGETHTFASKKDFWEIFVNNVPAASGACGIKLKKGDHLLFAAVSQTGVAYPTAIRAPRTAKAGRRFNVKVVYFNAKGVAKPLAGAVVSLHGKSVKTKTNGIVGVTESSRGTIVIRARAHGDVRAVPARVQVTT
jgi:hypothetical protein